MSKFKVGDRVVANKKAAAVAAYTVTVPGWCGCVIRLCSNPHFIEVQGPGLCGIKSTYVVRTDCFDLVNPVQKIVVTTDGKTTTARLYSNKELVKSAEAKCSPDDEFVFETGAAIALDRLLDREKKAEPEKLFPLEEIKAGYLLKVHDDDGSEYFMTVLPDSDGELGCCSGDKWWPVRRFGSELVYADSTIVEIYGCTCNRCLLANTTGDRVLLWSRK